MDEQKVTLVTNILNGVFTMVRAGISLKAIVMEVRKLEETGATPEEVSAYIKDLRNKALDALKEEIG